MLIARFEADGFWFGFIYLHFTAGHEQPVFFHPWARLNRQNKSDNGQAYRRSENNFMC